ncbi:MAG: thioredoxin fold domain-containing protein [Geminicoccaceae bacterium]
MSRLKQAFLALFLIHVAIPSTSAAELVMFESDACEWCDAWHAEIGPIYPKTGEGKIAPLRTVDIHATRPADLTHVEGVRYTPTFVLLDDDGREVGRINGYPGEAFFWGMLGEMIAKLPDALEPLAET